MEHHIILTDRQLSTTIDRLHQTFQDVSVQLTRAGLPLLQEPEAIHQGDMLEISYFLDDGAPIKVFYCAIWLQKHLIWERSL